MSTITIPIESVALSSDERFAQEALCWFDDVFQFAMMLTRNRADAEDLVQDTYLRCYQSWYTFEPGTDARRWLFAICHYEWMHGSQRPRRRIEHTDDVPVLCSAIDRLEEPYRSVLFLVDVEQQTYAATAEILDMPIDAVRSRLLRARRLVRSGFADKS
jgi:RNA polymerase sigma-70 factor, ECF subfamily